MKHKKVQVGKMYRIKDKAHPRFDENCKVVAKYDDYIEIQVGYFDSTVYKTTSGAIE